ncbi:MAG: hypothetical protein H7Z14_03295 [Anaerolineae bacterium]|nr:hypothetical protein [Phycisphaerae bacterium]
MAATTRFLGGKQVWEELRTRSSSAKGALLAAVAYFGKDGCDLLPLKKGDTLLVDMSLGAGGVSSSVGQRGQGNEWHEARS